MPSESPLAAQGQVRLRFEGFGQAPRPSEFGARDWDVNFVIIPAFSPTARRNGNRSPRSTDENDLGGGLGTATTERDCGSLPLAARGEGAAPS